MREITLKKPNMNNNKKKVRATNTHRAYSSPAYVNRAVLPPALSPAPVRQKSQHRSTVISPGATRFAPSYSARLPAVPARPVVSL